ncbi:MAG: hypothetical protein ACE5NG_03645 [bacterium]
MFNGLRLNLTTIILAFCMFLPITARTLELGSKNSDDKTVKPEQMNLPPIHVPNSYFEYLKKDLPDRRLLLEKCFLLIQEKRLKRIKNPSPQIQKFKKIIRLQLKIIEGQLNRKANYGIIQDIA